MDDFQRGMQAALQLAVEVEKELAKSMAHFVTVKEWSAYKRGVEDYKKKLEDLRDA